MGDIDVLIKEEDYIRASGILEGIGYKKDLEGLNEDYWLHKQCHVVFLKKGNGLRLELHHGLDFKRNNKKILAQIWSRTVEVKTEKEHSGYCLLKIRFLAWRYTKEGSAKYFA